MDIKKLLILSDFTDTSTPLLTYGLALAQSLNASVWVQHAYYIPPDVAGEVFIPVDALEIYESSIRRAFTKLKEELPVLKEKEVPLVISYGDLVSEVNKLIDQEHIDLVIMGNHGGDFMTNILGSNTIKVIQHAHCPVLSVPAGTEFHPFRRMALAVDLQETKSAVISRIADFARIFQAQVDIVHISETPVHVKKLTHALDASLQGITHAYYNVLSVNIEKGIEQHVAQYKNDLVVLLPRVHSFFDRLFQKSITRQVAYQKKVPLLTIHEQIFRF